MSSSITRPFVSMPGLYLLCKLYELKQRCKDERRRGQSDNSQAHEEDKRTITEKDFVVLNRKIEKLLKKLEKYDLREPVLCKEDECVVCMNHRATIRTYPCQHIIICQRCFVKTIQMALSQRLLPLRCVLCRAKIIRLKQNMIGLDSNLLPS